jgi:outer membrane autotransporter protein
MELEAMSQDTAIRDRLCRVARPYESAGFPDSRRRRRPDFFRLLVNVSLPVFVLAAHPAQAQEVIGGGMTVAVPGEHSSPWEPNGGLLIGYNGSGALQIAEGGMVLSSGTQIGFQGEGTVVVGGTFQNSGSLGVGYGSKGTLIVEAGGWAGNMHATIGLFGNGTVLVTGGGSSWISGGDLTVGFQANAELTIEAGGRVESAFGRVGGGDRPDVIARVLVSGENSVWAVADGIYVGAENTGNLTIENGGMVQIGAGAGIATIAREVGSSGVLTIGAGLDDVGNPLAATAAGSLDAGSLEFGQGEGALNFNHTGNSDGSDVVFAAAISSGTGSASINQIAGTTELSADSASFLGTTTVSGGRLIVANALGGEASVTGGGFQVDGVFSGNVTASNAGIVSGSGRIAGDLDLAAGGTLSPGNSIGMLTVAGDLFFSAGARFAVEVTPEGTDSDLVMVTGDATLNGGSVAHIGATGDYDLASTYTILSVDGTLSGAFDDVSSDFAFLDPSLIYDYNAGTIDLALRRNQRDFAEAALTRNQVATAGGIESIGFGVGNEVYDAIAQLADDDDLIRGSFDALSGEMHASAQTALIEDGRFIRNAANDRLRASFSAAGASVVPVLAYGLGETPMLVAPDHGGPVWWSQGFASWGRADGDGNAASLEHSTAGLLIGSDAFVGDWRVGLLAGYGYSSFSADDRASAGSASNYHLGLYSGTQWGNVALRTGAAYSWHDIRTNRSVSLPGLGDSLSGDYAAGAIQAFGELGYGFDIDQNTRLEPFVNLAHVSLHTDRFAEEGAAAALSGGGGSTSTTFTTLGVRGEHSFQLGTVDATLRGMLGWRRAFGDVIPQSSHAFSAGDAFTIAATPITRDAAVIEAGLDLNFTPEATLGFSYNGQIASDAHDHGFTAQLGVKF